jgi:hypothetical protein
VSERATRYPLRVAADVRTAEHAVSGNTRNISSGGVCVEIPRALAAGTIVELTLFVVEDDIESLNAKTMSFRATVQWSTEGEVGHVHGLQFVDATPQQIAILENALRALGIEQ